MKIINFGTKFWKSKSNVVFEINTLEFVYMQRFIQKQ